MSATRDQSQKFAFVYQNLYQLYRKGVTAAREADVSSPVAVSHGTTLNVTPASALAGTESGRVLKSAQASPAVQTVPVPARKVEEFRPTELLGKRIDVRSLSAPLEAVDARAHAPQTEAIRSLKQNLTQLQDLHSRLRFMLKELEELSK